MAWLQANPAKAQFGSPGAGALPHFFGLLVGRAANVALAGWRRDGRLHALLLRWIPYLDDLDRWS